MTSGSDIEPTSICQLSARDLAARLKDGSVSSEAAVRACLERIGDDPLHAFITLSAEAALEDAHQADQERSRGSVKGPLHGLPIAVKDLTPTAGIRTTFGSARYRDYVPDSDEHCVAKLKQAGAIVMGKTSTPEFGFGATSRHPYGPPAANPWDRSLTSGGSSGGSAVAVASGMVPLAHGTDFGGSVRTPASFCGCVGLRPTLGLIAEPGRDLGWSALATNGVLARNVEDAALMLAAMAGAHPHDPGSYSSVGWAVPHPEALLLRTDPSVLRIAASDTLGGHLILEPAVQAAFQAASERAASAFPALAWAHPDVSGAEEAFRILRAAVAWNKFKGLLEQGTEDLSETFAWNVAQGRDLTADQYLAAEAGRTRVYREFMRFFETADVLLLPAASVLPFPNSQEEVHNIGDYRCETIIDYLAPTFLISLVGFPSVVIPALWTDEGKPFGVQLVGRPFDEATLLAAAFHLQQEAGFRHRWPPLC